MNSQSSIKRFIFGTAMGLFLAMICWSYSAYYHVSIPVIQGAISSLLLAIAFGIIATLGDLDKLMDNLPFL